VAKGGAKLDAGDGKDGESVNTSNGRIVAQGESMAMFADTLAGELDQPMQDLTGLAGVYNMKLEWTPEDAKGDKAYDNVWSAARLQGLVCSRDKSAAMYSAFGGVMCSWPG